MSDSDTDSYDPSENAVVETICVPEAPRRGCASAAIEASRSSHVVGQTAFPSLSVSADAASGATGSKIGAISPLDETFLLRGIGGRVRSVCINPMGSILCAGGECGSLCFWDFASPLKSRSVNPTRILTPFPNRISGFQAVISVHSACDGSYFVACQDGDSPVLVAANGKQLGYCSMGERGMVDVVKCKGHRGPVTSSAPSPTLASRFFTGSQDSTARVWDAASFETNSVYAVKHGSGQLLENVVVESVLPLLSVGSDKTCVFASGGEDGLVQLWDSRLKYRPGGVFSVLDMYGSGGLSSSSCGSSHGRRTAHDTFSEERHVGGMAEPDPTYPTLCVRCGPLVRIVDLRNPAKSGTVVDVCPPLTGLPSSTDTGPLVTCTSESFSKGKPSFIACTSRSGYQHIAGGHIVQFTCTSGNYEPSMVWRPASADADVVAVAVDATQQQLFAGTQNGTVVARIKCTGTDVAVAGPNVQTWFGSRPMSEPGMVRQKRGRAEGNCDDGDELRL
ncbi:WD domain, G-beta repeat, putative [Trypanosoma equiperdum]|nr:WD domain, G-beta repeat, putative [Trypanosoma equiperdum]